MLMIHGAETPRREEPEGWRNQTPSRVAAGPFGRRGDPSSASPSVRGLGLRENHHVARLQIGKAVTLVFPDWARWSSRMPDRGWTIHLPDGSRILVEIGTKGSEIIHFAVVLLSDIDGCEVCITRYDTAHRQPHRDVLGRRAGLIEKRWMVICTNSEGFAYALDDRKANHEEHIGFYLRH